MARNLDIIKLKLGFFLKTRRPLELEQEANAQISVLPSNSKLSCSAEWNQIVPFVPGIAGTVVLPHGTTIEAHA
jgi:hypothetical protein